MKLFILFAIIFNVGVNCGTGPSKLSEVKEKYLNELKPLNIFFIRHWIIIYYSRSTINRILGDVQQNTQLQYKNKECD